MTATPRSFLFVPGSRPDRFAKAAATKAGALILDLEDAVAESEKDQARSNVAEYLSSRAVGTQQIVVRINPIGRAAGLEDLVALARLSRAPDYILVPKAEQLAEIALVSRVLEGCGSPARLAALIESAAGVAAAADVARAQPRMAFLMFGAADYAADLGQQVGVFRPDFARATLVNAAAAGGVVAIDSPFFAIDQLDVLHEECLAARALGFHGKAAIHPSQLNAVEEVFSPTEAERAHASRIIEAAPDGVGVLDGKMVDVAMVRWARSVV